MAKKNYSVDTLLSRVGNHPEANHGIVNPPVYRAPTVLFPTVARFEEEAQKDRTVGVACGRAGMSTTFALEEAAELEGGSRASRCRPGWPRYRSRCCCCSAPASCCGR